MDKTILCTSGRWLREVRQGPVPGSQRVRGGEPEDCFLRRLSSVLRRFLEGKKASKKPPETF